MNKDDDYFLSHTESVIQVEPADQPYLTEAQRLFRELDVADEEIERFIEQKLLPLLPEMQQLIVTRRDLVHALDGVMTRIQEPTVSLVLVLFDVMGSLEDMQDKIQTLAAEKGPRLDNLG